MKTASLVTQWTTWYWRAKSVDITIRPVMISHQSQLIPLLLMRLVTAVVDERYPCKKWMPMVGITLAIRRVTMSSEFVLITMVLQSSICMRRLIRATGGGENNSAVNFELVVTDVDGDSSDPCYLFSQRYGCGSDLSKADWNGWGDDLKWDSSNGRVCRGRWCGNH